MEQVTGPLTECKAPPVAPPAPTARSRHKQPTPKKAAAEVVGKRGGNEVDAQASADAHKLAAAADEAPEDRAALKAYEATDDEAAAEDERYAALLREVQKSHDKFVKHEWEYKMWLGEKVHLLETQYKRKTTAKFVKDAGIDIAVCTVERYRSVYRAWYVDISAPGPISIAYSVARALQTHPNRLEIITKNPKITKREAEALMEELEQQHGEAKAASPDEPPEERGAEFEEEEEGQDRAEAKAKGTRASERHKLRQQYCRKQASSWRHEEVERWFRNLIERANQAIRDTSLTDDKGCTPLKNGGGEQLRLLLREIIDPEHLPTLRKAGAAWIKLADFFATLVRGDTRPTEQPSPQASEQSS